MAAQWAPLFAAAAAANQAQTNLTMATDLSTKSSPKSTEMKPSNPFMIASLLEAATQHQVWFIIHSCFDWYTRLQASQNPLLQHSPSSEREGRLLDGSGRLLDASDESGDDDTDGSGMGGGKKARKARLVKFWKWNSSGFLRNNFQQVGLIPEPSSRTNNCNRLRTHLRSKSISAFKIGWISPIVSTWATRKWRHGIRTVAQSGRDKPPLEWSSLLRRATLPPFSRSFNEPTHSGRTLSWTVRVVKELHRRGCQQCRSALRHPDLCSDLAVAIRRSRGHRWRTTRRRRWWRWRQR